MGGLSSSRVADFGSFDEVVPSVHDMTHKLTHTLANAHVYTDKQQMSSHRVKLLLCAITVGTASIGFTLPLLTTLK